MFTNPKPNVNDRNFNELAKQFIANHNNSNNIKFGVSKVKIGPLTKDKSYVEKKNENNMYNYFFNKKIMIPAPKVTTSSDDVSRIESYLQLTNFTENIVFYDSFPDSNNAESELLKRFQIACETINQGMIIINNAGIVIKNPYLDGVDIRKFQKKNIICIISLHFTSPKNTDHYTLMALWNPILYHSSKKSIENVLSCDGFLSSHSDIIDNRMIELSNKPIVGYFNNSTQKSAIKDLTFGDMKCFYCGINWYALPNSFSKRTDIFDLLKKLESENMVSIYGPKMISNVNVWEGFSSYQKEIPFDGISLVREINKSGICLVLSSKEHIDSGLSSNRLFEGLAAGVPIISDRNPFVIKWFGDNVFYIDNDDTENDRMEQIKTHIQSFKDFPEYTMLKMKKCRDIFLKNFIVDDEIQTIVNRVKSGAL